MFRRYAKTEAPLWQRRLVLLLGGLSGATFLLFVVWAIMLFIDWARVDNCLDQGGSYDYEREVCDFEASHPSPDESAN